LFVVTLRKIAINQLDTFAFCAKVSMHLCFT